MTTVTLAVFRGPDTGAWLQPRVWVYTDGVTLTVPKGSHRVPRGGYVTVLPRGVGTQSTLVAADSADGAYTQLSRSTASAHTIVLKGLASGSLRTQFRDAPVVNSPSRLAAWLLESTDHH